ASGVASAPRGLSSAKALISPRGADATPLAKLDPPMKVPLSWLREYVDVTLSVPDLAERLTLAGLEVSGLKFYGLPVPPAARIGQEAAGPIWARDKVITARVLKVDKHPNADKLKLVTAEYGAAEPKVVVTGAPNIQLGDSGQKV